MACFMLVMGFMNPSCKTHPILTKETVGADGTHRRELRVFCDERGRSVPVDVCRACPVCVGIDSDDPTEQPGGRPVRNVRCTPNPALVEANDGSTGRALNRGVVVVDADLVVRDAVALFVEHRVPVLVVVDASGHAEGVVYESQLIREIQDATYAGQNGVRLGWSVTTLESVSQIASTLVSVPETSPLRDALMRLAKGHLRQVIVVDEQGTPVGLLRDVDALRGLRPGEP